MTLPTLKYPTHRETLPSGLQLEFRPYTMNEEKVLLTGKEGGAEDALRATLDVMRAVVVTKDFEPLDLHPTDVEFLFLRIRAKSVDSKVKVRSQTPAGVKTLDVDLDDIKVLTRTREELAPACFEVAPGVTACFRLPTMRGIMADASDAYGRLASCLASVTVGDDVQTSSDFTADEARKFVLQFDVKAMEKLQAFMQNAPSLQLTGWYEHEGQKKAHPISGLSDFLA
jgi:hypothetical protein